MIRPRDDLSFLTPPKSRDPFDDPDFVQAVVTEPPAPKDPYDLSGLPQEVRDDYAQQLLAELTQQGVLSEYERLKASDTPASKIDSYYEAHKDMLVAAGISTHYPPLTPAEQAVIEGWIGMSAGNDRRAAAQPDRQSFYNKHASVIRKWQTQHGGKWPL